MPFAATVALSTLNGTNGFQINPETAGSQAGTVVGSAGDINGDGFEDFVVSAVGFGGAGRPGAVYVVFGHGSYPANFNLSTINGTNGFQVNGAASGNYAGSSVAAAGDVNNDGFDDLIIGASGDGGTGAAYVLYGKNTAVSGAFASDISTNALTGSAGFKMIGDGANANTGYVVSSGDFNGDGIEDLVVGAVSFGGGYQGRAYVVFGQHGGPAGPITLSALNGSNGFIISNPFTYGNIGAFVDNAGDVNGDGFDDVIVGAGTGRTSYGDGAAYIIYGKASGFSPTLSLNQINGTNGFIMTDGASPTNLGHFVSSAGDINHDGHDDFMVGDTQTNTVYVVFGKTGNFAASFDVSTLNGTNGFKVTGPAPSATSGFIGGNSGSALGDVNGDGIDDLAIGNYFATNGVTENGSVYVIFGRNNWASTPTLAVTSLDGTNGFRIDGEANMDRLDGVGTVGDVNGDGVDDIIVGTSRADVNGTDSGGAWVVYGIPGAVTNSGTPGDDTINGSGLDDTLGGAAGKDTLNGLGGDDSLDGGADNDFVYGGDGTDNVSGGDGRDTVDGGNGNDTVNGNDGDDKLYGQAGTDTLTGGTGNDYMYGGSENDNLTGNDGNDMLDGGTGADTMAGGLLNDVYIVDSTSDVVTENFDEGYDIIRSFVSIAALAANVEGLQLQGSGNLNGTGNGDANNIQGNSGANILNGGAGVDTINGDDGDDRIIGGTENDLLRGGTGADTFVVAHTVVGVLETDQVYDFSDAEGDRLDLSGAYGGTIVEVASFGKHAGEMTLTFAGGLTTVRLDTNGDGKADYQMKINGDVTDHATAWLL
ncbi:MAG: hypothetical protein JWR84_2283 [Caulobacter sp.]|nr:hypothetical protein [Caulobacter sp.]